MTATHGTTPHTLDQQQSLAEYLRASSSGQHRDTETRSFITELMSGHLSLEDYTRYLGQYAWVYEALEQLVDRVSQIDHLDLFDPNLERLPAIESDLAALGVQDWRHEHPPLPATTAYIEHLQSLTNADSVRCLAHHYTRYLGDLSGGQAIASLVARHYGAEPEQLGFYRFDAINNIVQYKRAYRDRLNALSLAPADVDTLVAEVDAAFTYNGAVFDGLAN
jgi:heme oxygenase